MPTWRTGFTIVVAALVLAACQTSGGNRRELGVLLTPEGTGPGATGQSLPPASPAGPIGGTVDGGLAASEIGRALDSADREMAAQAEFLALESTAAGAVYQWQSRHSPARGSIVPGEPYQVNRSECRDFTHTIVVGGKSREWRGAACRQSAGRWRAVPA